MNTRYVLGALLTIPLLPILYFQGKQIRKKVPKLPEAEQPNGKIIAGERPNLNLLFIGESTFAGVGVKSHEVGLTGQFSEFFSQYFNCNLNWSVYAKSGYLAQDALEKLIPLIKEPQCDLILIGLGANDAFNLNSPRKWNRSIRLLIQKLKQKFPDAVLVFANMPPIKEFPAFTKTIKWVVGNLVEILGQELAKTVNAFDAVYYYDRIISFDDWTNRLKVKPNPKDYFSDGVHPSALTYQIWAKDLFNFISNEHEIKNKVKAKLK